MTDSAHKIHLLYLQQIIQRVPSTQIFAEPVKEAVVADHKTAVGLGTKIMGADFDQFLGHVDLKILQDTDLASGFDLGFVDSAHELPPYRKMGKTKRRLQNHRFQKRRSSRSPGLGQYQYNLFSFACHPRGPAIFVPSPVPWDLHHK